ncbi:MAG: phage tail protein [Alphaproteobacteria bacterium]|nr:phage tail protein [Alphaproteobacteria bacterium]
MSNGNGSADVPVGTVIMWLGQKGQWPTGWLYCDNSSVSASQYQGLFNVIGTTYGGDSSNFNLPDFRGYFVRGVDDGAKIDPDAADRTLKDGSKPASPDTTPGTYQSDELKSHTHGYQQFQETGQGNVKNDDSDWGNADATSDATGGSETRPMNVAVFFLIKAE